MGILAIDVGTSSVKAGVLDGKEENPGTKVARVGYVLDQPVADADEVAAERLWEAITYAARQAAGKRNEALQDLFGGAFGMILNDGYY